MPAAAVIPAPIAYVKVVAVKKLVVEFLARAAVSTSRCGTATEPSSHLCVLYCEKIRVFKAGVCLNTLAWNNKIGLWCYFVGCAPR